ncbi:MAG: hypothetical protein AB1646_21880 [Thermodesulfobacteriota bacterium]
MDFSIKQDGSRLNLTLACDISGLVPEHIDNDQPFKIEVLPEIVDDPFLFGRITINLSVLDTSGQ